MARTIRKENPLLLHLVLQLRQAAKKHEAPVWSAVAERLSRGRHRIDPVNVGTIERLAAAQDWVVVPGKLLADGTISKPVTVGAFAYSAEARNKIHAAGGKALTLPEFLKSRPDGSGVRLLA